MHIYFDTTTDVGDITTTTFPASSLTKSQVDQLFVFENFSPGTDYTGQWQTSSHFVVTCVTPDYTNAPILQRSAVRVQYDAIYRPPPLVSFPSVSNSPLLNGTFGAEFQLINASSTALERIFVSQTFLYVDTDVDITVCINDPPAFSQRVRFFIKIAGNSVPSLLYESTASPYCVAPSQSSPYTAWDLSGFTNNLYEMTAVPYDSSGNELSDFPTQTLRLFITQQEAASSWLSGITAPYGVFDPPFTTWTASLEFFYNFLNWYVPDNGDSALTFDFEDHISILVNDDPVDSGALTATAVTTEKSVVAIAQSASASGSTFYFMLGQRDYSHINLLRSLDSSVGLSTDFTPRLLVYTQSVANSVTEVTLSAATLDTRARVFFTGNTMKQFNTTNMFTLTVGDNVITATVMADDQFQPQTLQYFGNSTNRVYTITINRAPSSNSLMATLVPSVGSLSPVFDGIQTNTYSIEVAHSVTSISFALQLNVTTATVTLNGDGITIDGNADGNSAAQSLAVYANVFAFVVTAEDGVTQTTYTVTVNRAPSADALLSNLVPSAGSLSPTFSSGTNYYIVDVVHAQTAITFTPTLNEANAAVIANGVSVSSGAAISPDYNLIVYANVFEFVVTAQDGVTTQNYTVVVHRAPSADATLSSLVPSAGSLSPTFSSGTNYYIVDVVHSQTTVTFTPTVNEANAAVTANGVSVSSGAAISPDYNLIVYANVFEFVVTAQDGVTTQNYTVVVHRAPSADASLSGLVPSAGSLSPTFSSGTNYYIVDVVHAQTAITFTPTVNEANAAVTANGVSVSSGAAISPDYSLIVYANVFEFIVTAQDGITTQNYTVVVHRAPSADASLSGLVPSAGSLSPTFSSGTNYYIVDVVHSQTTITFTPTVNEANAAVTANGVSVSSGAAISPNYNLIVYANVFEFIVTAQDGVTTQNYTVVVHRAPSADASLSNLVPSAGSLSPTFSSGTNYYTLDIAHAQTTITFTPTVNEANAAVTANGVSVSSGAAISPDYNLIVYANVFEFIVTAQDGITTQNYTVVVHRAPSADASLSGLVPSAGSLSPTFSSGTNYYIVDVVHSQTTITFTPTVNEANAAVTANGVSVSSGAAISPDYSLIVYANVFEFIVTAQDGITTQNYTVVVHRAPSADASLSGLVPSAGSLSPTFSSGTNYYIVDVVHSQTTVTFTPTLNEANAAVTANGVSVSSGAAISPDYNLIVYANVFEFIVTAQDGVTTQNYTVVVHRAPSADASLSSLVPSDGSMSPTFAPGIFFYTVGVEHAQISITFTPTVNEANAAITANGVSVSSGAVISPRYSIDVYANVFEFVVTAQDGITQSNYTVLVHRAPAADSTLSALVPSTGILSPPFSPITLTFTVAVPHSQTSITFTPAVNNTNAAVTANGVSVASGAAIAPEYSLVVYANVFEFIVTAQDGITQTLYTVTVNRAPSADASLSGLVPSTGSLSPSFSSGVNYYTLDIAHAQTTITFTPTVNEANAAVTANGVSVSSGAAISPDYNLIVYANVFEFIVTAQDGITTQNYTVVVHRAPSADASLSGLVPSAGSLSPTFSSGVNYYTIDIAHAQTTITFTPTLNEANAAVTANGISVSSGAAISPDYNLIVYANVFEFIVTAQDGVTTQNYTVVVHRAPSADALLSNLVPSAGSLSPTFSSGTNYYTLDIAHAQTTITFTPTVNEANAAVTANGVSVSSGAAISPDYNLIVYANVFEFIVTAQDGVTTQNYTVVVHRAPSADATLSSLVPSAGSLSPTFSPSTSSYTIALPNDISSIFFTATASNGDATATLNNNAVVFGVASAPVDISVYANNFSFVVTAQDGVTTQTYTVVVNRAPSSVSALASLSVPGTNISDSFSNLTTEYSAFVTHNKTNISFIVHPADQTATVTVNNVAVSPGVEYHVPGKLSAFWSTYSVVCAAQDGITTTEYVIKVFRAPSTDPSLEELDIQGLDTAQVSFAPQVAMYSFEVSTDVETTSFEIRTTAEQALLNVSVAYDVIAGAKPQTPPMLVDAAPSAFVGPIPLVIGQSNITILVIAQDGRASYSYTILLRRQASVISYVDSIGALKARHQAFPPFTPVPPSAYTIEYNNSETEATVFVSLVSPNSKHRLLTLPSYTEIPKVPASSIDASSPYQFAHVVQNLMPFDNPMSIEVVAEDGTTKSTYAVNIRRDPSAVAVLTQLANSIALTPPFSAPGKGPFERSVQFNTTELIVTPRVLDPTATIRLYVNGVFDRTIADGSTQELPLIVGINELDFRVYAEDGYTVRSYKVVIQRYDLPCARTCSNNGICIGLPPFDFCQCFDGYTGDICQDVDTGLSETVETTVQAAVASGSAGSFLGSGSMATYGLLPFMLYMQQFVMPLSHNSETQDLIKPFQAINYLNLNGADTASNTTATGNFVSYSHGLGRKSFTVLGILSAAIFLSERVLVTCCFQTQLKLMHFVLVIMLLIAPFVESICDLPVLTIGAIYGVVLLAWLLLILYGYFMVSPALTEDVLLFIPRGNSWQDIHIGESARRYDNLIVMLERKIKQLCAARFVNVNDCKCKCRCWLYMSEKEALEKQQHQDDVKRARARAHTLSARELQRRPSVLNFNRSAALSSKSSPEDDAESENYELKRSYGSLPMYARRDMRSKSEAENLRRGLVADNQEAELGPNADKNIAEKPRLLNPDKPGPTARYIDSGDRAGLFEDEVDAWDKFMYRSFFDRCVVYEPLTPAQRKTMTQSHIVLHWIRSKFTVWIQFIEWAFLTLFVATAVAWDGSLQLIMLIVVEAVYMCIVLILMPFKAEIFLQTIVTKTILMVQLYLWLVILADRTKITVIIAIAALQIAVVPIRGVIFMYYNTTIELLQRWKKARRIIRKRISRGGAFATFLKQQERDAAEFLDDQNLDDNDLILYGRHEESTTLNRSEGLSRSGTVPYGIPSMQTHMEMDALSPAQSMYLHQSSSAQSEPEPPISSHALLEMTARRYEEVESNGSLPASSSTADMEESPQMPFRSRLPASSSRPDLDQDTY
jgi:Cadherin-like beta sandwich domain